MLVTSVYTKRDIRIWDRKCYTIARSTPSTGERKRAWKARLTVESKNICKFVDGICGNVGFKNAMIMQREGKAGTRF